MPAATHRTVVTPIPAGIKCPTPMPKGPECYSTSPSCRHGRHRKAHKNAIDLLQSLPRNNLNRMGIHMDMSLVASLGTSGLLPTHSAANWAKVTSDRWVLETIMGYKVEFLHSPHRNAHQGNTFRISKSSNPYTGDTGTGLQRSDHHKRWEQRWLHKPDLPCPQVRWVLAPSRQLEIPQHMGCSPPLQDGVHQYSEGVADTGGLDGKARPQGRLPVHPNSQVTSEVPTFPTFPMGQQRMAVSGPSFWSEQCAIGPFSIDLFAS